MFLQQEIIVKVCHPHEAGMTEVTGGALDRAA